MVSILSELNNNDTIIEGIVDNLYFLNLVSFHSILNLYKLTLKFI